MTPPIDENDSIIRSQWLGDDSARNAISMFEKRFGARHVMLACHASLPLILTPELINLIRINFTERLNIPWIAEADILLSPLCRPIGDGLYEFEPKIREFLLKSLTALFGPERPLDVAEFLLFWMDNRPALKERTDVAEPLNWIAMAYVRPHELIREMEARVDRASDGLGDLNLYRAEQIRLVNIAEMIRQPMETSEEKERFQSLLRRVREIVRQLDDETDRGAGGSSTSEPKPGERMPVDLSIGNKSIHMEFAYIPPGSFMMGSPENEKDRFKDETLHPVTLTQGFYMMTTPVTQALWKALMGKNPSRFKDGGPECPVENVSWHDAQEFIEALNRNAKGYGFRLPTEAEWEYACRAGSQTAYCFGDDVAQLSEYAWYDKNSDNKTHPVAKLKPNEWGLYDMHGNVWEWCWDWFGDYPTDTSIDPVGPQSGSYRVRRGGSWDFDAAYCRSASRNDWPGAPSARLSFLGFRLVLPGQQEEPVR